jgi:DNA-binding transcriptional LysR family regulator
MNVTLRQVRVFAAVATAGSFTQAAEQLCLTQSTLTKSVQELETCIGLRLFERTTRKLRLTGPGKAFLPVALRLLNDLDASIVELRQQASGQRGPIKVCCGTALATTVMPGVIKALHRQYPEIHISLVDDSNGGVMKRVADGGADFGFCTLAGTDGIQVNTRKILSAQMGVLFPRHYQPLPDRVTPDMLDKIGLILDPDETGNRDALHGEMGASAGSHIAASSLAARFSLVEAGVGPCIVSALAASHPSVADLPYRLIEGPEVRRELFLIFRKNEQIAPVGQTFIEVLLATLPHIPFRPGVWLDAGDDRVGPTAESEKHEGHTSVPE